MNEKPEVLRHHANLLIKQIDNLADRPIRLMEVCGTHTVAIFRNGIRQMLPDKVELLSGPGCPVCVTPNSFIDTAIAYSRQSDVILTTFGDMLKVPGSKSSLLEAKSQGRDIRIVYSPLDSLKVAAENIDKKVIFLSVGFETTAPLAAATVKTAKQQGLKNFYLLTAHKVVPPALKALLLNNEAHVDGFLLPGHVSSIIGVQPYAFLSDSYHIPGVVAGFEALDILQSIYMLVKQIHEGEAKIENQYTRAVPKEGNPRAVCLLEEVFELADTEWRGMGMMPNSGLILGGDYRRYDALYALPVEVEKAGEAKGCRCGEVLRGAITPKECPLFGKVCTPESPVGACMVSVEGTCAAWFKYGAGRWQG